MAVGTAWIVAFLPAWDREELRQFVAPWGDNRLTHSHALPVALIGPGRSAGAARHWVWECVWRTGACRVASRPAPARQAWGRAPPQWSEPARTDALLRADAHASVPGIVMDIAFGLPLPCMAMRAEVPMRRSPFAEWRWSGSVAIAPPHVDSGPAALRTERQHGLGQLPLTPLWGGLAVNTAAWACLLGSIVWVWNRVRWMSRITRRDAGRCASCGYAMARAGARACPECGAARELPLTDRAAGRYAAGGALVLAGAVAWGVASDVPVRWRGEDAALLWPTLVLAELGVVLLCTAWGRGRAPAARAPHAVALAAGVAALAACVVWAATLVVVALHTGSVTKVVFGLVALAGVLMIGAYVRREPRGGGARFVWVAAVASGVAALWGGLHLLMSASDYSAAFNVSTPDWKPVIPAVSVVLGVAAGWLVEQALRRPG